MGPLPTFTSHQLPISILHTSHPGELPTCTLGFLTLGPWIPLFPLTNSLVSIYSSQVYASFKV